MVFQRSHQQTNKFASFSEAQVSQYIAEGANAFLLEEYKYMVVYMVLFSVILGPFVGQGTTIAFIVGAVTSCLSPLAECQFVVFAMQFAVVLGFSSVRRVACEKKVIH